MTKEEGALALALIPAAHEPLTLSELEQYLAAAADLLRGSIDQADFKPDPTQRPNSPGQMMQDVAILLHINEGDP